jgi:protein-disulfide isomerase
MKAPTNSRGRLVKTRSRNLSVLIPLAVFLSSQFAPAQQTSIDDLKKQVETLSQNMKTMQQEVQEMKALLQTRMRVTPAQNAVLDLAGRPSRGESNAKLTLIEFLDYECPYCGRFSRETLPEIDREYIQTGKVKYVVMNLPLEVMHKSAFKAAEAAACAGEQGKFWEMHDRLYANQGALDQWKSHAEAIGLDVSKFEECLNSGRQAAQIRSDMAEAQKAGMTGTPGFFLARTDEKSTTIKTVTRLVGSQPFSSFKAAIDKQLVDKPAEIAKE